jgi:hypothetical protein
MGLFNVAKDQAPKAGAAIAGLMGLGESDDAEAGVALSLAKGVDLDRLVSAWRKAVSREPDIAPETHLQNIMHNKDFVNYNDFAKYARNKDGGKNGETYFAGLKPMLLDISKHPNVAKDNRLRTGLTTYAKTRFSDRIAQGKQAGNADPMSLLPIAGLGGAAAMMSPEDAEAGIIRHGTPDVVRLLQNGMLKTDSDRAVAAATKKYDKLLTENPAFAHREELAGNNNFQTVREQSEFDTGQNGYLTMDDLQDYTVVPVRSDRSMIGTIDSVGGIDIPRETVQGGFQFPQLHAGTGRGWGSGEGVARGQHNKFIKAAEETGREVLAAVNMMGPDSINFSTPIARTMQKQFDQLDQIPAADKKLFDDKMRNIKGMEEWPGIDDPKAMDWLMGTNGEANIGKRRTEYSTLMGKAEFRDKGFPNYKEAVDAASHDGLIDLNLGDSGMSIYKPDLTKDVYADDWHDTYSHVMPGEYVGRLENPVPFGQMFNGKYDSLRNEVTNGKHEPKPYTHEQAIDAANKRSDGYQVADDEWAKRFKQYESDTMPQVRAVGAPTADSSLLSAQLHNHEEGVAENMQNLGIDYQEDPMYDYGTFLPFRQNIVTGKNEMAMPSALRSVIRGLFDVAEAPESGVYRPDGLFEVL